MPNSKDIVQPGGITNAISSIFNNRFESRKTKKTRPQTQIYGATHSPGVLAFGAFFFAGSGLTRSLRGNESHFALFALFVGVWKALAMVCIFDLKFCAPYLGLGPQIDPQTTYTNTTDTQTNPVTHSEQ